MRYHVAGAAIAAALVLSSSSAVLAADPGVAPIYNWSGFYAGVHVGYGWGDADLSAHSNKHDLKDLFDGAEVIGYDGDYAYVDGEYGKWLVKDVLNWLHCEDLIDKYDLNYEDEADLDGFLGGIQLGFNVQNGNWVYGLEGDISGTDLNADSSFQVATDYFPEAKYGAALAGEFETSIDWLATLRGRVGYAFDNVLVYATGGLALGDVGIDANLTASQVECWNLYETSASISDSDVRFGYVVGAGVEVGITETVSIKGEYQFIDLGDDTFSFGEESTIETDVSLHVVKVGLNVRFSTN